MSPSNEGERMELSRTPYALAVRSLMFVMICTKLDIAQAVGAVTQFMANLGREHWNIVKRILRYIKRTSNAAICFGGLEFIVKGYVDSDFTGDLDKRKSTTGYVFTLTRGAVSQVSKLQTVAVLSTIEVEYMSDCFYNAGWTEDIREVIAHLHHEYPVAPLFAVGTSIGANILSVESVLQTYCDGADIKTEIFALPLQERSLDISNILVEGDSTPIISQVSKGKQDDQLVVWATRHGHLMLLQVKYLGEDGENIPVAGAVAICNPWDLLIGDRFISRRLLQKFYDMALASGLQGYAQLYVSTTPVIGF
ncbi:Retrovirus-related Pol polyprotein from transposon TNT 1-94 [Vitis vinifera]|uniref:Retrovirus-related Pol polyprotein from transposon TNT 1-94 n=1 Tax=Vitis vinifera TaxID=29760 RepID=A0A438DP07_VITVI|nr:Retrovirus-related Pol polyprotein from transposon TNT 1-94 [Vitis vinifera]